MERFVGEDSKVKQGYQVQSNNLFRWLEKVLTGSNTTKTGFKSWGVTQPCCKTKLDGSIFFCIFYAADWA